MPTLSSATPTQALLGLALLLAGGCAGSAPSVQSPTGAAPQPPIAEEPTVEAPVVEPEAPAAAEAPVTPTWTVTSETEAALGSRTWRTLTLEGALDEGALSASGTVWLYAPPELADAPILVGLPGWKFSSTTWEEHAAIGELADRHGFRLALIDMNVSIYESSFYPETAPGYRWCGPDCGIPGARWVGEVVAPYLRTQGHIAGLFGLSTGGRGAVLLPQLYPGLADRACAMSGTYDLFDLPPGGELQIHQVIYGSREQHPDRWRRDDTLAQADRLEGLSALVIHGALDGVVSPSQSQRLVDTMRDRGLTAELILEPGGGHDWALWSKHLPTCFEFFAR